MDLQDLKGIHDIFIEHYVNKKDNIAIKEIVSNLFISNSTSFSLPIILIKCLQIIVNYWKRYTKLGMMRKR